MAQGAVTNRIQVMRSIAADFKRIKQVNGFFTDIGDVLWPNWDPDDLARCLAVRLPAILLWRKADLSASKVVSPSDMRPTLEIYSMGLVQGPKDQGLQEQADLLFADHEAVWFSNGGRDWPGSTVPNTWGLMTIKAPDFEHPQWRHWGAIENEDVRGFEDMTWVDIKSPLGG